MNKNNIKSDTQNMRQFDSTIGAIDVASREKLFEIHTTSKCKEKQFNGKFQRFSFVIFR